MRLSLRLLLILIALLAVACAGLKYANDWWWSILSGLALLLFMAMAVLACVGCGERRMFAVGFTICAVIYGAILFLTSKLLSPVFQSVVTFKSIDTSTGQKVPFPPPYILETPQRSPFMLIGHLLWSILFASLGGLFARFIYAQDKHRTT